MRNRIIFSLLASFLGPAVVGTAHWLVGFDFNERGPWARDVFVSCVFAYIVSVYLTLAVLCIIDSTKDSNKH